MIQKTGAYSQKIGGGKSCKKYFFVFAVTFAEKFVGKEQKNFF